MKNNNQNNTTSFNDFVKSILPKRLPRKQKKAFKKFQDKIDKMPPPIGASSMKSWQNAVDDYRNKVIKPALTPYLREIIDVFSNTENINEVVIMKGSAIGKTQVVKDLKSMGKQFTDLPKNGDTKS